MGKFIIFLYRLANLYLYFVLCACVLSWIPNVNPDYPLFHFIFKFAGFYLIPPVLGLLISPAVILIVTSLVIMGLSKIYNKFFEPQLFYMSSEQFLKNAEKMSKLSTHTEIQNKESEDFNNDGNKDN